MLGVLPWSGKRTAACLFSTFCFLFVVAAIIAVSVHTSQRKRETLGNHSLIVNASYLANVMKTKTQLCIIDATFDYDTYVRGHMPGAQFFNKTNMFDEINGTFEAPHEFEFYIRTLGVNDACHVIVYDSGGNPRTNATWVWWIFRSYEHPFVSVLQGGLPAWIAENGTLEAGPPKVLQRGDFYPRYDGQLNVDFEQLTGILAANKTQILDVREPASFEGYKVNPKTERGGHIPGAVNVPLSEFMDTKKDFASSNQIAALLSKHGLLNSRPLIVYSDTARDASLALFVLKNATYNVTMFAGGWIEYSHKIHVHKKVLP